MNTIDYDFNPKHFRDKDSFNRMIAKIWSRKCCAEIRWKDSFSKGIHMMLLDCIDQKCDMCRIVFDDTERYRRDVNRPKYAQNVLFTAKHIPLLRRTALKVVVV